MADGIRAEAPGGAEPELTVAEGRLLRGVRVNLSLWSAGITLAILLVLGLVLYVAVARSLAADSVARLLGDCPVIHAEGRPFPVRVRYQRRGERRSPHSGRK